MDDVLSFFRETQEAFTVYVVEQRFVVGRGLDYFKSFKGKVNYIDSNGAIRKQINRVLRWIQKNIPSVSDLVEASLSFGSSFDVVDAITILNKLFSVHAHQAVGPDVIDPIIIQEGTIDIKYITQIISLHEKSILQPVIIILLKDNDFERATKMLSHCPHGINIKLIRNSGQCEIYKVVNTGVDNITGFMDAFAQQCFSTCSHTPRNILMNEEWAGNSQIKTYMPSLLGIRSNLIMDEKNDVRQELQLVGKQIDQELAISATKDNILQCFQCIAKLMLVFCNDAGGQDIKDAYQLAKAIDNPLLLAQVYRYAYFMNQHSQNEQISLLKIAEKTFYEYGLEDQALYSKNNRLTYQFEQERIHIQDFETLQEEAIHNVPGLVGMSHILNNVGVAYLMVGNPELAITYLKKGMDYARRQERSVQRLAIECNTLIARSYCYERIEANELRVLLNRIFDSMGFRQLPFISARLAMNVVSIAFKQNKETGKELLREYPIRELTQKAFQTNLMGSGMLVLQMQYLDINYSEFNLLSQLDIPRKITEVKGLHREYIVRHGYNPFIFCTWL